MAALLSEDGNVFITRRPDEFATWLHLALAIFGAIALSGLAILCTL